MAAKPLSANSLGGDPIGVVLTGGSSSRMGRDKASLRVAGQSLAARTVGALSGAGCSPIWVVGHSCPTDALEAGGSSVPDRWPGSGPLAAISQTLDGATRPLLTVPCDLPELTASDVASFLAQVQTQLHDGPLDAAFAELGGSTLWVVGWWSPSAAAPLAAAFARGERSVRRAAAGLVYRCVPVGSAFRDADHPSDLGLN